jgi:hypothetical protein
VFSNDNDKGPTGVFEIFIHQILERCYYLQYFTSDSRSTELFLQVDRGVLEHTASLIDSGQHDLPIRPQVLRGVHRQNNIFIELA